MSVARMPGSRAASGSKRNGLTSLEQRVVGLVADGLHSRDIAKALRITEHVVKNYIRAIYDKLGVWNRLELALWHEDNKETLEEETCH